MIYKIPYETALPDNDALEFAVQLTYQSLIGSNCIATWLSPRKAGTTPAPIATSNQFDLQQSLTRPLTTTWTPLSELQRREAFEHLDIRGEVNDREIWTNCREESLVLDTRHETVKEDDLEGNNSWYA